MKSIQDSEHGNAIDFASGIGNVIKAGDGKETSKTQVYRDFSGVLPDPLQFYVKQEENDGIRLPFKLNKMLSDPEFTDIITWLPHGRSFMILQRNRFASVVLPKFYNHSNVESFLRLINAWGFRRINSGPDSGSYYHELFLRGMPHLHVRMKRIIGNKGKAPTDTDHDCPNFHDMPMPFDYSADTSNLTNLSELSLSKRHSASNAKSSIGSDAAMENVKDDGSQPHDEDNCKTPFKVRHSGNGIKSNSTQNSLPDQKIDQVATSHEKGSFDTKLTEALRSNCLTQERTHGGSNAVVAAQNSEAFSTARTLNEVQIPTDHYLLAYNQSPPTVSNMLQQISSHRNPASLTNSVGTEFHIGTPQNGGNQFLNSFSPSPCIGSVIGMTEQLLNMPVQSLPPPPNTNQTPAVSLPRQPNQPAPPNVLLIDIITNLLIPNQSGTSIQGSYDPGSSQIEMALQLLRTAEEQYRSMN